MIMNTHRSYSKLIVDALLALSAALLLLFVFVNNDHNDLGTLTKMAQSTCKGIGELCGSDSWWGIVGFGCYGNAVSVPSYKCEHSGSLMGIWTLWLGSFAYKSEDCCSGCLYWECGWASLGACDYYCGRLA